MSDLFRIEFLSVKDPQFKKALKRATIEELKQCFQVSTISKQTEKCCLIYAELRRKKRSLAKKMIPSAT